jgi:hypothetical protein
VWQWWASCCDTSSPNLSNQRLSKIPVKSLAVQGAASSHLLPQLQPLVEEFEHQKHM